MGKDRREQFVNSESARPAARVSWNAVVIVAFIAFFGLCVFIMQRQATGAYANAGIGGDLSFPLSDFADGNARFYSYTTTAGKQIRFFVMRSADGVTRAAFDTCDVCFKERRGYRQAGASMICNNCEQAFHSESINEVRGGCNPAPLDRAIVGDRLVLRAAALEQGAFYF
jgi:uncharacterized membrane protein